MSIGNALQSTLSGLNLVQQKFSTTTSNITNADTPGYTKKTVKQGIKITNGTVSGVELQAIERKVNDQLLQQVRTQLTQFGSFIDKQDYLSELQTFFSSPDNNRHIGSSINTLLTSLEKLTQSPNDISIQKQVIVQAQTLSSQFNELADKIQDLRLRADNDISTIIEKINTDLEIVKDLNSAISSQSGANSNIANLMDQRDEAVKRISEYIEIRTFNRENNQITIQMPGGKILLDSSVKELSHSPIAAMTIDEAFDPLDPTGTSIKGIFVGQEIAANDITQSISNGRLKGLVELRDSHLPKFAADMEKLAITMKNSINEAANRGTSSTPPSTLTGTRYFSDTSTNTITLTSDVRIALVGSNGKFEEYVDLPAGTYTNINQLVSDINSSSLGSIASVAGGNLVLNHGSHGIAIADLGSQTISHDTTSASGFSNYFGLNDLLVDQTNQFQTATVSGTLAVRSDIASNPNYLMQGQLTTIASPISNPASNATTAIVNGQNLTSLSDALSTPNTITSTFVHTSKAATPFSRTLIGDLPTIDRTATDFAQSILNFQSQEATKVGQQVTFQSKVYEEIQHQANSENGVNIDEELAMIIQLQHSYAAMGKVMSAATKLFEILEDIAV